jgi:SAM-dependent methyltransferase
MTDDLFARYGTYYDLLYRDKDYAGESARVIEQLRAALPDVRTVLEFGSGTGRHGGHLARAGLVVHGIERSPAMVAAAAERVGTVAPGAFSCEQGDIRRASVGRRFDAVVSLFHVVSYQTENADLLETFSNAARHLRDGGVFFFDVWHGPAVLHERPVVRVKELTHERARLWRIAEPELDANRCVVTVRYTLIAQDDTGAAIDTIREEHRMRYLFPPEIDLLARATGFEVASTAAFPAGGPPSERTWGVGYLLRKKNPAAVRATG